VTIAYPATGQTVAGIVTVSAAATDDQGVQRVEFFVDGVPAGSDTTYPYQLVWSAESSGNGPHTLKAVAYDSAGHSAQAETTVQVSLPRVFIEDATVQEQPGGTTVTVDVSLADLSGTTITVDYATVDGTAVADEDYEATSGTLTFLPGVMHGQLEVTVLGDGEGEATEDFSVALSGPVNATLGRDRAMVSIVDKGAAAFHIVAPCRLVDTRQPSPSWHGPLVGGVPKTFQVAGLCGVPVGARAAAVNLTAVAPTTQGNCRLYPNPGGVIPLVSNVNFAAGQTRANNAIVPLGPGGTVTVYCSGNSSSLVHFVLDVGGYFW
jgi:hypothetical protein